MRRDLLLVALSLFAWGLGESSFLAYQPLYLQQLGANPINIGAILGGYGLATALAHIPAGYLADRFGRRPVMWTGWILGVIATWIMGLASNLNGFVAGMLMYGLTLFVMAPINSYVTAARGNWSVGRAVTLISAAYNLGAIIGPLLGGSLGARFGYRSIFLSAAAIFSLSTGLILLIRSQPVEQANPQQPPNHLFRNRAYLVFLTIFFLAAFAMYMPQPLSPNFMQNQHQLDLEAIGRLYSIAGVGIVVFNVLVGSLSARLGFILGQLAIGLFAFVLWRADQWMAFVVAFFLIGGFRTARMLGIAQIRTLVSGANMGLAFGVAETVISTAMISAPLLAGFLYDRNPVSMYVASFWLVLISVLVSLVFMWERKSILPAPKPLPREEEHDARKFAQ